MRTFGQFGLSLAAAAALLATASFAQPAPPAPAAAPRARSAGVPVPGQIVTYLGVAGETLDAARRPALKVKEDRGVVVTQVLEGTPAEKAGLKLGDVIVEYNGHSVESWEQFRGLIQDSTAGKPVKLLISRNGAEQTLTAVPINHRVVMMPGEEMPWPMIAAAPPSTPVMPAMPEIPHFQTVFTIGSLGILGEELSGETQFAEFFGVKDGLLIKSVSPNSVGERAGIKAGDVLLKFDDRSVTSARELQRALRAETKPSFPLTVIRNRKETVLTVTPQ
jgi:serine protease Do